MVCPGCIYLLKSGTTPEILSLLFPLGHLDGLPQWNGQACRVGLLRCGSQAMSTHPILPLSATGFPSKCASVNIPVIQHAPHGSCLDHPRPSTFERDLSQLFSKEQHDLPDKLHLGKPRGFGPFTKRLANQMDVHSSEVGAMCFVQSHMGQL